MQTAKRKGSKYKSKILKRIIFLMPPYTKLKTIHRLGNDIYNAYDTISIDMKNTNRSTIEQMVITN